MDSWRRRHPDNRLPVERPARIELRVRKGFHERERGRLESYDDEVVCNCFPRTSNFAIPSMFYDKLRCPHKRHAHIQPAQQEHFDYPWTPNSEVGRKHIDDDLSERLSLMSREEDQLRFSPGLLDRRPAEVMSVATAPPYWFENETNPRTNNPPHTAPADYEGIILPLAKTQRALSLRDLRHPELRQDDYTNDRRTLTQMGTRKSRLSNRQFTGNYVDPKNGKVYQYNVNYDGTPHPQSTRKPVDRPARKPFTAQ